MSDPIPLQLLRHYSQSFPLAWRQIASMREDRGKALPYWPDWCYCPIAASVAVITKGAAYLGPLEVKAMQHHPPAAMATLAAWRITKGIYRFDESLLQELAKMPLEGDLPAAVFYQLPEWSVYIETPGMRYLDQGIAGFFASLEYDANDGRHELRLLFVSPDLRIIPVPLHLGKWTLRESLRRFAAEGKFQQVRLGLEEFPDLSEDDAGLLAGQLIPYLNLIIYICSANADYGERERPQHPSKRPKRKGKLAAVGEVQAWDVGVRVGAALRRATAGGTGGTSEPAVYGGSEGTRARPRPHIRIAHWHHFWTGSRGGERELTVKWLPPIAVNVTNEEENQPAVIRPVKKEE